MMRLQLTMANLLNCLRVGATIVTLLFGAPRIVTAVPLSLYPQLTPNVGTRPAPKSPADIEFEKGKLAFGARDLKTAEAAYSAAVKLDPGQIGPLLGLADVALIKNTIRDADMWLRRAVQIAPKSPEVHLGFGKMYMVEKLYQKAEQEFKIAANSQPTNARAHVLLGDLYLEMLKPAQAIVEFRLALAAQPNDGFSSYGLGVALSTSGQQLDEAKKMLQQATRLAPQYPEPWRALGRLHAEQKQFKEATTAFSQAIKLNPNDPGLLLDRGDVLLLQNDPAAAISDYQIAVSVAPKSAAASFKLGVAYQQAGNDANARNSFISTIKLDPKHAMAYNNLAWLAAKNKTDLGEALTWAKTAIALNGKSMQFLDTLAWVHRARGELDQAVVLLKKLTSDKGAEPEAFYHLGVVFAEQGKKAEARLTFERALSMGPSPSLESDTRKELLSLGHK